MINDRQTINGIEIESYARESEESALQYDFIIFEKVIQYEYSNIYITLSQVNPFTILGFETFILTNRYVLHNNTHLLYIQHYFT